MIIFEIIQRKYVDPDSERKIVICVKEILFNAYKTSVYNP